MAETDLPAPRLVDLRRFRHGFLGLYVGSSVSAFLFPLYLWMILGNGVRFGAAYMAIAVACTAIGFAA